ncbi:MAG: class I SAM-dependent methyltransferase [Chloroflexota bacterium]
MTIQKSRQIQASYDQSLYPNLSYVHTHPDRLATLATLLGLAPAPVSECRMLEIGCASGANLIPMAYGSPQSTFVGVDFSVRQIESGQAKADALGLTNIQLIALDIMDMADAALGTFDYIVAHGIYSWTPEPVRDQMLAVIKQLLAPTGIAYVSYNTYPGWHMAGIVRDLMLFHTRSLPADSAEGDRARAQEARNVLKFMAASVPAANSAYASFLQQFVGAVDDELKGNNDGFLLHDEMEAVNDPVYFYQFAEHIAQHGLRYLVEAELRNVLPHGFQPEVLQHLQRISDDPIEYEQYMDFLRNRMFRQSLLCHDDVEIGRSLRPDTVQQCYVSSRAQVDESFTSDDHPNRMRLTSSDGGVLTTDHPVTLTAMAILRQIWPQAMPFHQLYQLSLQQVYRPDPADPSTHPPQEQLNADIQLLASNLIQSFGYSSKLVGLHRFVPSFALQASEKPAASPVARREAQDHNNTGALVTNLWHDRVQLTPTQHALLQRMDGTRDMPTLLTELTALVASGELEIDEGDELAKTLELDLLWLIRAGVMVG